MSAKFSPNGRSLYSLGSEDKMAADVTLIVRGITRNPNLQDDLFQEGVSFLLRRREVEPGHSESYYRQACHFFILDRLKSGRSVDSFKRTHLRSELPDDANDDAAVARFIVDETARSAASANDIIAQLRPNLSQRDQEILLLLAQGFEIGAIARRLRVSHQHISQCRKRIAARAIELGLDPRS